MLTLNPLEHLLLFCADKEYQKNNIPIPNLSGFSDESIIKKFRKNKISLVSLPKAIPGALEIYPGLVHEINKDAVDCNDWSNSLVYTSKLFRQNDVNHIFIKVYNPEWAMMSDVDILPPSGMDEYKALDVLSKDGFTLYEFRLLAYPLKIMAKKKGSEFAVDFYPKPMWVRRKVCDTEIMASRIRESTYLGVPIMVPSPEDDLFLVATHGYNHLRANLTEILHAINVLKREKYFDWEYFASLALDYGAADSIFMFLRVVEFYSAQFHSRSLVPQAVFDRFLNIKICQKFDRWLANNCFNNPSFPLNLPPSLACGSSSFYHCRAMINRESTVDLVNDFFSSYLSWASKIFMGSC